MLKGIIKDYGLIQVNGNLGCFYGQEIMIGTHVNDLLAIMSKETLDKVEEEIGKHVEVDT